MKFTLTIDCDSAAFEDGQELSQLLGDLAERVPWPIESTPYPRNVHDSNGNHVGSWEVTP